MGIQGITRLTYYRKNEAYGFSRNTSNLLNDFLRDCQQCVKLQNHYCDWIALNHGVPQSFVLCPLVFILYVNDFKNQINRYMNLVHFADDTIILLTEIQSMLEILEKNCP